MRAGLLNQHIEILTPTVIKNVETGSEKTVYTVKTVTKARVDKKTGSRDIENNEVVFNYVKIFYIRIYHKLSNFDRLKHYDKLYRIIDIDKDDLQQQLKITCELINE